ncbi:MAG: hypothetical protein JW738_06755 [Actinobacteria bacterium]|nr:hypothetical protein [Actinomycetota bacterium]
MKKYTTLLLVVLIAVCSMFLYVNRETVTADEVLSVSLKKMMNAASFEAKGIVCHKTDGEGIRHSEVTTDVKVDFRNKKNIKARIDMDIGGTTTKNYMIGNTMYINVPQSGWKKAPLSMFESGSPFLIQDVTDLMECAKHPVMQIAETAYIITFDINPNLAKNSAGRMLAEVDGSKDDACEVADGSKTAEEETVTRTTLYVDKETLLVNRAVEEKVHLLPSGGDFEREILTTTEYKYFNYNYPVSIELPEEAETAPSPRR